MAVRDYGEPLVARPMKGWGHHPCIAPSDAERPLLKTVIPKAYYTDFPKYIDDDGREMTVLSSKAAREAGNYVATREVKDRLESDAAEFAERVVACVNALAGLDPSKLGALLDALEAANNSWYAEQHLTNILDAYDALKGDA